MIEFELRREQIQEADHWAHERQKNAEEEDRTGRWRAPVYGSRALEMNLLGCRTERVSKAYLDPIVWHFFKRGNLDGTPDLSDFIDVKGVPTADRRLIVSPEANDDWAYLLVKAHRHPIYEIHGWMWGWEAKKQPLFTVPGRATSHFISSERLRDPQSLYFEVRKRQRDDGLERLRDQYESGRAMMAAYENEIRASMTARGPL